MVKRAHASKSHLVYVPVEGNDRLLLGENFVIEKFDTASDTHGDTVNILEGAVRRVVIFIEVESTITS